MPWGVSGTLHSLQDMQEMQDRQEQQVVLLTAEQVSRLLHIDASTVYRMAGDGRLAAVKVGRQWRFPADRISRLLDLDDGIDGATNLTELTAIDADRAQPVIDVAADLLGVMMVVTDMQGRPLTEVANPCPWFTDRASEPDVVQRCAAEWQALADDLDFDPRFQVGALGFECARAFVRDGSQLVGMVLAGGVAPDAGQPAPARNDLYTLDPGQRQHVLATLPKVAATLSRVAQAATTA
jgi:excisionase family DNA binding protein